MRTERFNTLTVPQQCYYTNTCGVYLASTSEGFLSIDLYQVGSFYVEVFYHKGETECLMARAFEDTFLLEKYLEKISIVELF